MVAVNNMRVVKTPALRRNNCATMEIQSFARTGCSKSPSSKAAGESKPEAYPLGYVEDFDEPRTLLADFFSILLEAPASAPDNDAGDHHRGRQKDDLQIPQGSFL